MSYSMIGEQIQKFRRAAGITQKELGEYVGISAQAVSQWEGGGTPDVTLLPAIADKLGVTIDALFGREKITGENMKEALSRYVASLPESKRVFVIFNLMWEAMKSGYIGPEPPTDDETYEFQMYYAGDEGIMLGTSSEHLSFMSVFPEPKGGYAAFLPADDKYRELFSALCRPNALRLLKLLYQRMPKHCTVGVIAKLLDISVEETSELLSVFADLKLVTKLELEADNGSTDAYIVNDTGALVPFLYSARTILMESRGFHLACNIRKTPLLKETKEGE